MIIVLRMLSKRAKQSMITFPQWFVNYNFVTAGKKIKLMPLKKVLINKADGSPESSSYPYKSLFFPSLLRFGVLIFISIIKVFLSILDHFIAVLLLHQMPNLAK